MTGFVHLALLYRSADEYLAGTVPFVRDGFATDEPVMVAVPCDNLARIRAALGAADAGRVELRDMSVVGRNPGRIIPGVLLAFAARHGGRRVRIIGEPVWAGRSALEYPACVQHEALVNTAFAGRQATILCPYDTSRLEPAVVDDARRTHPMMISSDLRWDSPSYRDPVQTARAFNQPLPAPPAGAATIEVTLGNLGAVRRFVAEQGTWYGLPANRVVDLVISVNEVASNTVEHGGGTGVLVVWPDGAALVCQLRDAGRIEDPMAGRIPVPPDCPDGGRGLLMVNELCDLVRIHTGTAGTTVRLHVR